MKLEGEISKVRNMDGRMDGRKDGRMEVWMEGRKEGRKEGRGEGRKVNARGEHEKQQFTPSTLEARQSEIRYCVV